MDVNKITWAQAGRVTDPGRYMFRFGWLTITADDLAVWQAYPNAAFTLIRGTAHHPRKAMSSPPERSFDWACSNCRSNPTLQIARNDCLRHGRA